MKALTGLPNATGTHPNVVAQGDTLPGQHDGTPLLARWLNELFGFVQATMNGAYVLPSGTCDAAGSTIGDIESCQIIQALQHMIQPAGVYVALASNTIPQYSRMLACNGQVITCATYPRLVANTYCGTGSNPTAPAFYKCTNPGDPSGSRSTSGLYFKLPDLRGQFLGGYDPTATVDPDGAAKKLGGLYDPSLINHGHGNLYLSTAGPPPSSTRIFGDDGASIGLHIAPEADCGGAYNLDTGDPNPQPEFESDDDYSAPTHSVAYWCITY